MPNERSYLVVGFAAETHDIEESAQKKLRAKNCDMIVANDVSRADVGMESDENAVEIFSKNGARDKNFAHKKNFHRARTRKKNLRDARKTFDKKNVMLLSLVVVNLFTTVHKHRDCGLKGGILHASEEKSEEAR